MGVEFLSEIAHRGKAAGRPTILHIVPRFQNDGTMNMVRSLLKEFDAEKYRLILCALNKGDAVDGDLRKSGVKIILFDMRHWLAFHIIWRLARLMKREHVTLVHTHRARPDIYGRIAARLAGVPCNVSTQHYVGEWAEKGPVVHILYRLLFQWTMVWCDKVVANSNAERNRLSGEISMLPGKVEVIYNGVDLERFSLQKRDRRVMRQLKRFSIPPEHFIVGTVAFLVARKGIHHLLEAGPSILARVPNTTFLIVGGGPLEKSLKGLALDKGIGDRVVFTGHSDCVAELIPLMDIFCLTSLWEPFGLVLVEAMACGKPVVAFGSGGIPEVVENGIHGRLVCVGDTSALADAIVTLLADAELRAAMGREGRRRAKRLFSSRSAAHEYSELYESCLRSFTKVQGSSTSHVHMV